MKLSQRELDVLEKYKVNPEIIKELEEARSAKDVEKETAKSIKRSLSNLEEKEYQNIPVISTLSGNNNFLFQEESFKRHPLPEVQLVDRVKKWRTFGDIAGVANLETSDAERIDTAKKKADRYGYSSKEDLTDVRGIVLDVSHVGIATKEPEKEKSFDDYLFNKYAFFGMTQEQKEIEREKERDSREEREYEAEQSYSILSR